MIQRLGTTVAVLALSGLVLSSCGDDDKPTGPSGGGGTIAATITITANGVSPKSVTVSPGSRVTFVNNDSGPHDMNSDPHPEHSDCRELNGLFIQPGQSGTSQNLKTIRTCGYHDHTQPFVTSRQGTIRIQ